MSHHHAGHLADTMTFSTNLPSSSRPLRGQNPVNGPSRSVFIDRSAPVLEAPVAARRIRYQSPCGARRSSNSTLWRGHTASWRLCARRVDSPILPPVIQLGREAEKTMDLYSYLLRNRIVFLGGFVDFEMATKIVGSILALDALDSEEDIKLYINSPGGSIYAILGVVDVLRATKADVSTVAFGITGGNASLILAAGTKSKRYAMPSSRILLQQPAGYIAGSSTEANITATELNRSLQVITHLYAEFTGQSVEQMEMETNRENFLSPEAAVELGIIDAVV